MFNKKSLLLSGVTLFGGLSVYPIYRKFAHPLDVSTNSVNNTTVSPLSEDSELVRVRIWRSGYYGTSGSYNTTTAGYVMVKSLVRLKRANIVTPNNIADLVLDVQRFQKEVGMQNGGPLR